MADPIAYAAPTRPRLPTALLAVAWLFIAFGILAAVDILWAALNHRLSLNFTVLDLFIGLGLLRLNRQARTWALVFLWFELVIFVLMGVLFILARGDLYYSVNGVRTTVTSWTGVAVAIGILLALFALSLWQLVILMRPSIRALFISHS